MIEKYQPCNGTEGCWFIGEWCDKCIKFPHSSDARNQCGIFLRTICYDVTDKEYPEEWQRTEDGPICTAFKSREEFNAERRVTRKTQKKAIATDTQSLSLF